MVYRKAVMEVNMQKVTCPCAAIIHMLASIEIRAAQPHQWLLVDESKSFCCCNIEWELLQDGSMIDRSDSILSVVLELLTRAFWDNAGAKRTVNVGTHTTRQQLAEFGSCEETIPGLH